MAVWIALLLISPFALVATAQLDGGTYQLYVADHAARWTIGYMNVTSYDPRRVGAVGMAFLFPRNATWCFWMKNTYLPLKIVWVSGTEATGWVYAEPLDVTPRCGFGDKVVELRPDIPTPRVVILGEQRLLH